jgi:methylenetetrahydrofolate--tRNA-(uracil-5-)-methyltransferase
VLGVIPALASAEFLRYGVMHRNPYIDSPRILTPGLAVRHAPRVRIAGQLAGTEGYLEAAATGLLAALDVVAALRRTAPPVLPPTTALGALIAYATDPHTVDYQPMHVNFGLMPPLVPPVRRKKERYAAYAQRARRDLVSYLAERPELASLRPYDPPSPPAADGVGAP